MAVLSKDTRYFDKILDRKPDLEERHCYRQTPAHLACDWPYALQKLLIAGADIEALDYWNCSPLSYSFETPNLECVRILLDADCDLVKNKRGEGPVAQAVKTQWSWDDYPFSSFNKTSRPDSSVQYAIISCLVTRRQRLLEMAEKLDSLLLTEVIEIVKFHAQDGGVLDEKFLNVTLAIEEAGIQIPQSLLTKPSSLSTIYHTEQMPLNLARHCFQAGFRDVDVRDTNGFTPLMGSYSPGLHFDQSVYSWLLSKGARLDEKNGPWYASHYLAMNLNPDFRGGWSDYFRPGSSRVSTPYARTNLRSAFALEDDCRCLCSAHGCVMLTMFLKRGLDMESILENLSALTEEDICLILRFRIFEASVFVHTCCNPLSMTPRRHAAVFEKQLSMVDRFESILHQGLVGWKGDLGPFSRFSKDPCTFLKNCTGNENSTSEEQRATAKHQSVVSLLQFSKKRLLDVHSKEDEQEDKHEVMTEDCEEEEQWFTGDEGEN